LQHSTIVAIDFLAGNSVYSRENLLEKFIEQKVKSNYLLNGCSIYLTHEPCIMCSMALLHSRISTVYYLNENKQFGALGSVYKLHCLKKINHRFYVYQFEEEKSSSN
jgi:tRNA-specific adenosine deaminase 3